jgi:RNA polymerase sigma factor (sigma-70 family)
MAHRVLREKGRARTLATELSQEMDAHDQTPLPDECIEAIQQRQIVQDALKQLAENNREVVSLHYIDRLSYAEIAAFLEVSETAVQGRLQRVRAALRKELNMVEKHFKENRLKENFAADIQRLLDTITADKDGRRAAGGQ